MAVSSSASKFLVCFLSLTLSHILVDGFISPSPISSIIKIQQRRAHVLNATKLNWQDYFDKKKATKLVSTVITTAAFSAACLLNGPALAEDELAAKYGSGFNPDLIDQKCLVDRCSTQAKACLIDDLSCRKGLTCTAKCLGDNSCITGCMARYNDKNLDNLLKCTIEDNACIKIAILEGGGDKFGQEPRAPVPTIKSFDLKSMEGSWYKVIGFNPTYDCFSCQRNTFSTPKDSKVAGLFGINDKLQVDVEFSMLHLLPDGTPEPPKNVLENIISSPDDGLTYGSQSIAYNDYETHEVMVFDDAKNPLVDLVLNKGSDNEKSYSRTAHTEGEMFGLKFWENWYIIGENNPGQEEFKFVFYNGKTRQNTYEGAFVYSRTRNLSTDTMQKVYSIAKDAKMNPDQFCRIRNGCFLDNSVQVNQPETGWGSSSNPFRGILASTKVSQLLGVEPVAAEQVVIKSTPKAPSAQRDRAWWLEVGDYLENPRRHFQAMDSLRIPMDWPEDAKNH
mmetsp:Transcript_33215/g.37766  ORF Transcript_33215/g.37766 Transcript_33215/m.37766 type:complete len:505 (-) Transcript_33215:365-1879(-)|eukprot:CAMPEP_0194145580 /NCGR_PEP_ID=MMETSP0152-20130528/17566_1 /TAXON_ID=1049557 /ORGANISM="Thalassiothrix antarctica, Strain L6-D1" /LENGTH=504 /DNA_ID=CAMNT_0038845853 /DNA_START=183 /DNA_END=1697 /DNA_ORIENTATION=+